MSDFLCPTLDPRDPTGPKIKVTIPREYIDRLSPVDYENMRAAKAVLDDPARIFAGLREHSIGGWCYTGRPVQWCIKEGTATPFPIHLVFAVYLNPTMRVYECRAERAATDDPLSPVDWQTRYRGLVWKRTS